MAKAAVVAALRAAPRWPMNTVTTPPSATPRSPLSINAALAWSVTCVVMDAGVGFRP